MYNSSGIRHPLRNADDDDDCDGGVGGRVRDAEDDGGRIIFIQTKQFRKFKGILSHWLSNFFFFADLLPSFFRLEISVVFLKMLPLTPLVFWRMYETQKINRSRPDNMLLVSRLCFVFLSLFMCVYIVIAMLSSWKLSRYVAYALAHEIETK